MKKRLVLFDFDGTITTKDTLLEFIRFYHGNVKFFLGFLLSSPWIALMQLKLIANWKAKEKVLMWFFKGEDIESFNRKCAAFTIEKLPKLVRTKAISEIKNFQTQNDTVVVISASAQNWVRPWCDSIGINCIATHLQVENGKLTGRIDGINCYGSEKERRIKECYDLKNYDEVIAYGDSRGDLEMLALAKQQFYKPFR